MLVLQLKENWIKIVLIDTDETLNMKRKSIF